MEKLYLDAGTVIVNLLKEEKSKYLTLKKIDKLVDYLYKQLIAGGYLQKYADIIFNVNFDAIERTVWFNNNVFDLIGDTIYLKSENIPEAISEKYKADSSIEKMIRDFVANNAA